MLFELGRVCLVKYNMKKSSSKSKVKFIYCNVFKRGVSVFIGKCNDLRKWAKKAYDLPQEQDMIDDINYLCNDENYSNNNLSARCYYSKCGECIVHIPEFSFEYDIIKMCNLAHEILHATHILLDTVGVEYIKDGTNETFTYVFEYMLRGALDKEGYVNV